MTRTGLTNDEVAILVGRLVFENEVLKRALAEAQPKPIEAPVLPKE